MNLTCDQKLFFVILQVNHDLHDITLGKVYISISLHVLPEGIMAADHIFQRELIL
jgi:hypothetical protein